MRGLRAQRGSASRVELKLLAGLFLGFGLGEAGFWGWFLGGMSEGLAFCGLTARHPREHRYSTQSTFQCSVELSWASSYWVPCWLCALGLMLLCPSLRVLVCDSAVTLSASLVVLRTQQEAQSESASQGLCIHGGLLRGGLLGT